MIEYRVYICIIDHERLPSAAMKHHQVKCNICQCLDSFAFVPGSSRFSKSKGGIILGGVNLLRELWLVNLTEFAIGFPDERRRDRC